jgi:1,4-dihydroxy-2-naphthoate octaprenyltransferase
LVLGLFLFVCAFLALEYTAPPLQLSYRTLGEIDVGLTHSVLAILAGLLVQGGPILTWQPWLLGLPLFLSILPAIILSGIPDHDADRAAGKRTIAVAFGIRRSFAISAVLAGLAAAAMIGVDLVTAFSAYGSVVSILVVAHAAWIVGLCLRERTEPAVPRRIDRNMVVALSFILWFCIVPLWRLAG